MSHNYPHSILFRFLAFIVGMLASIFGSSYNMLPCITLLSVLALFQQQEKFITTRTPGWFLPFIMRLLAFCFGLALMNTKITDRLPLCFVGTMIDTLVLGAMSGEIWIIRRKYLDPRKSLMFYGAAMLISMSILAFYLLFPETAALRMYLTFAALGSAFLATDFIPWDEHRVKDPSARGTNWPIPSIIFLGMFIVEMYAFCWYYVSNEAEISLY